MRFLLRSVLSLAVLSSPLVAASDTPFTAPEPAMLNPAGFSEWLAGKESAIPESAAKAGPAAVFWTSEQKVDWRGLKFGEGREAGVRHLRIGFKNPIAVGSVLVRGG